MACAVPRAAKRAAWRAKLVAMTDYVLPTVRVPLMSTAKLAFVTTVHAETRPSVKMLSNA